MNGELVNLGMLKKNSRSRRTNLQIFYVEIPRNYFYCFNFFFFFFFLKLRRYLHVYFKVRTKGSWGVKHIFLTSHLAAVLRTRVFNNNKGNCYFLISDFNLSWYCMSTSCRILTINWEVISAHDKCLNLYLASIMNQNFH